MSIGTNLGLFTRPKELPQGVKPADFRWKIYFFDRKFCPLEVHLSNTQIEEVELYARDRLFIFMGEGEKRKMVCSAKIFGEPNLLERNSFKFRKIPESEYPILWPAEYFLEVTRR